MNLKHYSLSEAASRNAVAPAIHPAEVHSLVREYLGAVDVLDFVIDLDRSQGSYIHDALSNRRLLDFFTCVASMPIGFNHPKIRTHEFLDQLASARSEERRVGKECTSWCRSRWSPYH